MGFDAMVKLIGLQAIVHSTKPIIIPPGAFHDKCLRKFARLLNESVESADASMKALLGCQDYETGQSLQGLGGCVAHPLRDCLIEFGALAPEVEAPVTETATRPRP